MTSPEPSPADHELVSRLRASRARLPEDRLQSVVARARSAAISRQHTGRREPFLRSRLALLLVLVLGFAFSGTGVGLAISGIASDDSTTSEAQYGTGTGIPGNTVLGEQDIRPAQGGQEKTAPALQLPRQFAARADQGGSLPFTGFAAIPVLLLGVGLLTTGFVMHRGSRRSTG